MSPMRSCCLHLREFSFPQPSAGGSARWLPSFMQSSLLRVLVCGLRTGGSPSLCTAVLRAGRTLAPACAFVPWLQLLSPSWRWLPSASRLCLGLSCPGLSDAPLLPAARMLGTHTPRGVGARFGARGHAPGFVVGIATTCPRVSLLCLHLWTEGHGTRLPPPSPGTVQERKDQRGDLLCQKP